MSKEYNQIMLNQNMLKHLQKKQKIREEKEAYEEAFNKLSNEEQIIIRKVEGELIQVNFKLMLEQMKKEEIKREKEEIKRLTKLIEDDRVKTERCNKIAKASFCIGVLAYVGLTIITR